MTAKAFLWQPSQTTSGYVHDPTQNPTNICNSPAVILGDSLATRTILLTVRGVNIDTRSLPGRLLTATFLNYCPDRGNGHFQTFELLSYSHFLICAAQQPFVAHHYYILGSFP